MKTQLKTTYLTRCSLKELFNSHFGHVNIRQSQLLHVETKLGLNLTVTKYKIEE